jgi:RNA polymerase sigma-70 factor (ECF subfamily)
MCEGPDCESCTNRTNNEDTSQQGRGRSRNRDLSLFPPLSSMNASVTFRFPGFAVPDEKPHGFGDAASRPIGESQVSDETLMAQVCGGGREALAILFRRYARSVHSVAYRVLRDASEADDLLQDIFILIRSKCSLFDPTRGPARSWILQVAYHCALGRRRYLHSRHFYTRVDLADVENELSDRGNGAGTRQDFDARLLENSGLKRVFDGLSEDQRQTLLLFFVEGYTLPEIAAKLNQSHVNVKHHYFRGLEKLRKHAFNSKLQGNSAV